MQIVKVMKCLPQEDNNSSFSNCNNQQGIVVRIVSPIQKSVGLSI